MNASKRNQSTRFTASIRFMSFRSRSVTDLAHQFRRHGFLQRQLQTQGQNGSKDLEPIKTKMETRHQRSLTSALLRSTPHPWIPAYMHRPSQWTEESRVYMSIKEGALTTVQWWDVVQWWNFDTGCLSLSFFDLEEGETLAVSMDYCQCLHPKKWPV